MYTWAQGGVYVPDVMTISGLGVISGTAHRIRRSEHGIARDDYFWEAIAAPGGYRVTVRNAVSARSESFHGSTFNLALEVASAVGRTL